jgi:FKBP-type peptidyl-prolyl cis-trans isomerase
MRLPTALLSAFLFASSIPATFALDLNNPPDGLKIEVLQEQNCTRASQKGDELSVIYHGYLEDGTEFDSSRPKRPFTFTIGVGSVIKGWDIGMMDMCPGEARKLTISPELAYGDRDMGKIPPHSTLIFHNTLIEIKDVAKWEPPSPSSTSSQASATSPAESTAASAIATAEPEKEDADKDKGSEGGPKEGEPQNGECRLLGPFAIFVQGALGLLALLSLVYKRWRERPQRPLKIWFFDASKQVFGSVLIHLANLFMSMLSSGDFDVKKAGTYLQEDPSTGRQPNPCSFYLLNLAIDVCSCTTQAPIP